MTPDNELIFYTVNTHPENEKNNLCWKNINMLIVNYNDLEETYQKIKEIEFNSHFSEWGVNSLEEVTWIKQKHQRKENLELILEED